VSFECRLGADLRYADGTIEGALALSSLNRAIWASMTDQSGQTIVRSNLLKSSQSPAAMQAKGRAGQELIESPQTPGELGTIAARRLRPNELGSFDMTAGVRCSFEESKRRPRCSVVIRRRVAGHLNSLLIRSHKPVLKLQSRNPVLRRISIRRVRQR
jgi:hypothetical protein